jgi:hypothetical protein
MDLTTPPWLAQFGWIMTKLLPGGILTAWCLWAVDWRKAWPVLAAGGWVPLVLIGAMAAAVWALVWPTDVIVLGFLPVHNGLWQIGSVTILIGVVLVCSWLQTRLGWAPPEITFESPPAAAVHGHDHHGHGDQPVSAASANGPPSH